MKSAIVIFLLILSANCLAQEFELKNGDIIFQEACSGNLDNTIKQVTSSVDNYQFTHVGIVYIDDKGAVFVLEANMPKVSLTPLAEYLYPPKAEKCYPKSVVGRLTKEYQSIIPDALKAGMALIGKGYDYGYVLNDDKYYCSELIYEILKQANGGEDVFTLNIMTFKDENTGQTTNGWIDYFNKHALPIPEGEWGINPGAMSRCDGIEIIHRY